MKLVVLLLLVVFAKKSVLQDDEKHQTLVAVIRRLTNDIEVFDDDSNNHKVCSEQSTYLVDERKCVSNKDLLEECSNAIVPTESEDTIAVSSTSSNITRLTVTAEVDGGATFRFSEEEKPLESSLCHVSSLEVFRGRSQAIKIDHDGFSLGPNGTIEINYSEVAYDSEEYVGELYRMNLFCSGGGLPQSGCLFFKVIGLTNITNAKFNCTVPGTLVSFHEECNIATTSTISTTALPPTTLGLTTTDILSPTSGLEIGRTYFLIVVICGVLAVVLVIAILVVCLSVCLLRRKVKPIASSVQMTSLGGEVSCKDESSLQGLDMKKDGRYHTTMVQDYERVISNGGQLTDAGTRESHIYAVLETPVPRTSQQQNANLPKTLNEAQESPSHDQRECQQQLVHGNAEQQSPQYEIPITRLNTNKPHSVGGFPGDTSEHKYAELEKQVAQDELTRQTRDSNQLQVHHYDAPPGEGRVYDNRAHPSSFEEQCNPVNHVYAILEKPA